jgi:hypothetical protein
MTTTQTVASIQATLEEAARGKAKAESDRVIKELPYMGDDIELYDIELYDTSHKPVIVSGWRIKEALARALEEQLFHRYLREDVEAFTKAAQQLMSLRSQI